MNDLVVLATADAALESGIRAAREPSMNGDLLRWSTNGTAATAAEALLAADPTVVAFGPEWPVDAALEAATAIAEARPEIGLILMADLRPDLWQRALRAGVRDVIAPDSPIIEMRDAIDRAREAALRARANLLGTASAAKRGRVLCVLSPKGGSGKTMVATNLSVALCAVAPANVALVDLDLQFGDVATALQLVPDHSLATLTASSHEPDATTAKILLTRHHTDLHVLCAPSTPIEAEEVSSERLGQALDVLADQFEYVVLDTGAGLDEHALAGIERATDLLLVCTTDVGSVRALRKELDVLDRLSISARRHVILNRADAKVGVGVDDIEATLGHSVDVTMPSSRSVPLAMNRGITVVESEPRSPVSRQVAALASRFVDSQQPSLRRRGRGGR